MTTLSHALKHALALPVPDGSSDKEDRGRILVIGGSAEMPGALLLAGIAALRAGAGKLVLGTVRSVAAGVAIAVPEARVLALSETAEGGLAADATDQLNPVLDRCDTLVVGPGMTEGPATTALVRALLGRDRPLSVVLDAAAMMDALRLRDLIAKHRVILTPHAGELAGLLGEDKDAITEEAEETAVRAAATLGATLVLKGARTWIAEPGGTRWSHAQENPGLATWGSGDVLAGLIGGLLARGATPSAASGWGVWAHAEAGRRLVERVGPIGFLARELLDEVPAALR